ncbi:MAG: NADH-quinone oxidoreductase subunit K 1 [Armatimonadota bacterium]|nr:MAG: NADH-quinone oxidoreductase subunit K 1 [Armatimonadota bacterium]
MAWNAPVPFASWVMLSAVLFSIGAVGFLIRKDPIIMFMCIELMLNAGNLLFIAAARYLGTMDGQVFVFFVMAVAAAEVAVGLAIIVAIFRTKSTIDVDEMSGMRG